MRLSCFRKSRNEDGGSPSNPTSKPVRNGSVSIPKQLTRQPWAPATFSPKQVIDTNETSPPYMTDMSDRTLDQLLGAKNSYSFDGMAASKTFLIMDETIRWKGRVGDAIRYTGWVISALLAAYRVTSRAFFMHHINTAPGILLDSEYKDLQFLIRLTCKEGLGGIVKEVNGYTTFRNKAAFNELQVLVDDLARNDTLQPDEKLDRVQAKIRKMLHSLSPGWDLRRLTENMTQWFHLFEKASAASEEAPVGYLGLTIAQAIQRARRDFTESRRREKTPTPLKIIILTGSELTETDFENLKVELDAVDGGASEFSVTVVYFGDTGTTSEENRRRNKSLDVRRREAADIYEAIFLNSHETLTRGLGSAFFIKALFSHDPKIDGWKVQNHEWYGPTVINHGPEHNLQLPTTQQIAAKLDVQVTTNRALAVATATDDSARKV